MNGNDYLDSFRQALSFSGDLFKPQTLRVTHRLKSVNDLPTIADQYDLILLDRDCTLQAFHAPKRDPRFEKTLQTLAPKIDLLPNASFNASFRDAGRVFSDLFPVNNLIPSPESKSIFYLFRIIDGSISVWRINSETKIISDVTSTHSDFMGSNVRSIKKPNPLFVHAVIAVNKHLNHIPSIEPKILMCGDRYLTDMAVGNLANIDTALVRPVYPFSHPPVLFFNRYLIDKPLGAILSRLAH